MCTWESFCRAREHFVHHWGVWGAYGILMEYEWGKLECLGESCVDSGSICILLMLGLNSAQVLKCFINTMNSEAESVSDTIVIVVLWVFCQFSQLDSQRNHSKKSLKWMNDQLKWFHPTNRSVYFIPDATELRQFHLSNKKIYSVTLYWISTDGKCIWGILYSFVRWTIIL